MRADWIEPIDRYLSEQMSGTERADFEAELATNAALAAQVEQQRTHLLALETLVEDELRQQLGTWKDSHPVNMETVLREQKRLDANQKNPRWWVWLLALLGVIGTTWWTVSFFPKKDNPTPASQPTTPPSTPSALPPMAQDSNGKMPQRPSVGHQTVPQGRSIAANYRTALQTDLTTMQNEWGQRSDASDTWTIVFEDMEHRRYTEAIRRLKTIPDTDARYLDARFLLAACYYLSGEYGQASPLFGRLAKNTAYLRAERAAWYEALATLGQGQKDKALILLRQIIAEPTHAYRDKALALRRTLVREE